MKKSLFTLALGICLLGGLHAGAQDQIISIGNASGDIGDMVDITNVHENNGTVSIQGYQWSNCILDPAVCDILGAVEGANASGEPGVLAAFWTPMIVSGQGWSVGAITDFFGMNTLDPGEVSELGVATYEILGPGTSAIEYCDTVGQTTQLVDVGTAQVPFTAVAGSVTGVNPNNITVGTVTGVANMQTVVPITITNVVGGDICAVQIALTYDDTVATFNSATNTGPAAGADFFEVNDSTAGELTIGIVMDIDATPGPAPIPAGNMDAEIVSTTWDNGAAAGTSPLTLTDGVGMPAIDNLFFDCGGIGQTPTLNSGAINVVNFNPFVRGNCNGDTNLVDIGDGIFLLLFLFQGGTAPTCDDACDPNDDGMLDSSDAIYIFNYRFLEGPEPAAPFPAPGIDPTTGDGIGCNGDADDI